MPVPMSAMTASSGYLTVGWTRYPVRPFVIQWLRLRLLTGTGCGYCRRCVGSLVSDDTMSSGQRRRIIIYIARTDVAIFVQQDLLQEN